MFSPRRARPLRAPAMALLAAALLPLGATAQDELGLGKMWTFENPPLGYLQREYGFAPDAKWFDTVRLASLRFGAGCSASFVSPQGLILTNHHCVRDANSKVQGSNDWVRDGFAATSLADEQRLAGLTVQQLVRTTDVTKSVLEGITERDDAAAAEQKRSDNQERLLAAARTADPGLTAQIVKLFHGAIWQLYQYRVYDDVRLVMAPHLQISHFGGDPDNFVFPRYAIDFAFCRAWVDGKPADTAGHHFAWSDGPAEGDLVFLTGNPGSTQRLLTRPQLEYLRDAFYPRMRQMVDNRIEILRHFARQSPEAEKQHRTRILGLENGQKLFRGEHAALLDPAFLARKDKAETAFKNRLAADGALLARYGDLWRDLDAVAQDKRTHDAAVNFHTAGGSPLLIRALALVDFERTGDAAKAQTARDAKVTADPVQHAWFTDHMSRARDWLPPGDPWLAAVLQGQLPANATARLAAGSRVGDDAFVADLLAGGKESVAGSRDPALVAARTLADLRDRDQKVWRGIIARENELGARLAQALFAVYGHEVTPDATFTLRFSDGRVQGYEYNGSRAPWRTVFHGMFARSAEFDGAHPFDLPLPWLLAKDRLDLQAPVDFVCTVDSTGGNSGSPVIDRDRRLVGLLFDGNIESLANEFLYGEKVERSVCVHPRAIAEALGKVYGAQRILHELQTGR